MEDETKEQKVSLCIGFLFKFRLLCTIEQCNVFWREIIYCDVYEMEF